MKHSYIRSFHASHQLNLQPMDNEREYLPWMSDSSTHTLRFSINILMHLLTSENRTQLLRVVSLCGKYASRYGVHEIELVPNGAVEQFSS
jgi:hypothetical protein